MIVVTDPRAPSIEEGVLLLNMGGPDGPEAIRPFLRNLFSDREIIRFPVPERAQRFLAGVIARARAPKLVPVYREMGGPSPQITHTNAQARLLEERLRAIGQPARVYIGMRYWKPFIRDAVRQMTIDGIRRATVLPLYPHYSSTTTGSAINELSRVLEDHPPPITWEWIRSWETFPPYVRALAGAVRERLDELGEGECPAILFSAHSIPMRFVREGDPYPDQIEATARAILAELDWTGPSRLAYQSRVGPIRWLTPTMPDMIRTLAAEGHKRLIVVPISFVSDHIETLEEIDGQYRRLAGSLGISDFVRADTPNERPEFIDALASLVLTAVPGGVSAATSARVSAVGTPRPAAVTSTAASAAASAAVSAARVVAASATVADTSLGAAEATG